MQVTFQLLSNTPSIRMNRLLSQGFWYFVPSRSREFQVNLRNPAKFTKTRVILGDSLELLVNSCRHNIFQSYIGCWGCLLAVNLLIYLETSSLQRVNIPKLPGVLRLMLQKTGKTPRCKKFFHRCISGAHCCVIGRQNPGIPRVDHGNWGRVRQLVLSCARSSWRMLRFVKDYALYDPLTYKDDDLFRNGSAHEW